MGELSGCVDSWAQVLAAQGAEEAHQRCGFVGVKGVAIGGHVTSTLHHLADHLVVGHMDSDVIKCGAAQSALAANRMAIAALLVLKDDRALAFERRAVVKIARGDRVARPRVHDRAPWSVGAEIVEY